jgi:hypothetical protein
MAAELAPASMSKIIDLRRDWTEAEDVEIARLAWACNQKFELECNHTDEGDPWCVVREGSTIILHFAKIDRRYLIAFPQEGRCENPDTMRAVIDRAVEALHRAALSTARKSG